MIEEENFLSNAYPCRIYSSGYSYSSVEHAYQASKTNDIEIKMNIRSCRSIKEIEKLVSGITPSQDWENRKQEILRNFLVQKFYSTPGLKEKLLATPDQEILGTSTGELLLSIKKNLIEQS